jgi:type VI secretion system secreted protein VgrG
VDVSKDDSLKVGKKFIISAGDELTITVGAAKLVMKKDGTIELNGKDFNVQASANMKLQAGAQAEIKASAKLSMEASGMAELKSAGILQVQGSLVKIN